MKSILSDNKSAKIEFTNIPVLNEFVPFEDKIFKINGKIKWSKEFINAESSCQKCYSNKINFLPMIYITIQLSENIIHPIDYINDIEEYYITKSHNLTLQYIRIFSKGDTGQYHKHYIEYYNGKRYSPEELKEKHIDSFFHKEKDRIFGYLYKINYEPDFFDQYGQCPRMNMILYGPTGSGKSSFINRVARALNRHIVSFDISSIKSKDVVYDIIQKPSIGIGHYSPNSTITVLEEIDIGIKQLHERDTLIKSLVDKIQNYMNSSELTQERKQDLEKILNQNNTELINDKESCKISDTSMYPSQLKNMISQYQELKKNFMLRDLLDILQGTVSVNGTIIFATTNKFEEIKDFCPELFRHGRMTPVYFGYFENKQMDQFLNYYFNKTFKDFENKVKINFNGKGEINIPTSQLVETALDAKIVYNDNSMAFDYFISKLPS